MKIKDTMKAVKGIQESKNVNEGQPVQGERFTPGEWYIGIDRETPGLTKYFFDRNGDETEEEAKANAVLIASAPTLLKENEQLKEQVRILESNGNTKNEIITNLVEQVRVLREAAKTANEYLAAIVEENHEELKQWVPADVYTILWQALSQTEPK